ncbi:MAG: hypothetical protein JWR88_1961 [Pseudonocardia sp.]|jgi:hypothetical protein|nr:hypothetical protein [Pseudonocardia sp.]
MLEMPTATRVRPSPAHRADAATVVGEGMAPARRARHAASAQRAVVVTSVFPVAGAVGGGRHRQEAVAETRPRHAAGESSHADFDQRRRWLVVSAAGAFGLSVLMAGLFRADSGNLTGALPSVVAAPATAAPAQSSPAPQAQPAPAAAQPAPASAGGTGGGSNVGTSWMPNWSNPAGQGSPSAASYASPGAAGVARPASAGSGSPGSPGSPGAAGAAGAARARPAPPPTPPPVPPVPAASRR